MCQQQSLPQISSAQAAEMKNHSSDLSHGKSRNKTSYKYNFDNSQQNPK